MADGPGRELLRFYAEVDAFLERFGPRACSGCGACCHFDGADHVLYAGGLERRLLAKTPRPADPDATGGQLRSGVRCPYQKGGSCRARETRPLGCRLFFCAGSGPGVPEEECERWHRRLKRLHGRLGEPWSYGPAFPLAAAGAAGGGGP